MNLTEIKAVDWKYLVNRKEAVLMGSITDNSHMYFKKITGIEWHVEHVLRLGNGDVLMSAKELKQLYEIFIAGGEPLLEKFKDKLIKEVSKFGEIGKSIAKK